MDSLMSVEIRNRLEAGLGLRLPATVLFTYTTLTTLATHILDRLGLEPHPKEATHAEPPRTSKAALTSAEIDRLSDEDLARMADELLI